MNGNILERLEYYSLDIGEHTIWCGNLNRDGYGILSVGGKAVEASLLAWVAAYGPLPLGRRVLHRTPCSHPACVRFDHLYLGTEEDNQQDIAARQPSPPASKRNRERTVTTPRSVLERLEHYSLDMGEHSIWCGALSRAGYGVLGVSGKSIGAHRLAWELAYGPIPPGMMVLHRNPCHHPACVRFDHLYLGTARENGQDKAALNQQQRTARRRDDTQA